MAPTPTPEPDNAAHASPGEPGTTAEPLAVPGSTATHPDAAAISIAAAAPGPSAWDHAAGPVPVVLVHGIRLSGAMWRPHRDRLAETRPAVAVDLPAHGSLASQRFSIDAAADTIAGAIDKLGGRALLVGISLGGYVAIATAARQPRRVAGLMAIGCTTVPSPALTRPFRVMARLSGDRGQWVQRQLLRLVLGRRTADMAVAGGMYTAAVPDVVDAVLGIDVLTELAAYDGPVWLVNGRRDHFRTDEQRFLAACRDGGLTVVPGAGHLVSLTHVDATVELIAAAAGELDAGRRPNSGGAAEPDPSTA